MVMLAPAQRRPRKAKPGTKGFGPAESQLSEPAGAATEATQAVEKAGGCVVGSYKKPLGGYPLLLAVLPIDAIEPTPFPRDLLPHHKRFNVEKIKPQDLARGGAPDEEMASFSKIMRAVVQTFPKPQNSKEGNGRLKTTRRAPRQ